MHRILLAVYGNTRVPMCTFLSLGQAQEWETKLQGSPAQRGYVWVAVPRNEGLQRGFAGGFRAEPGPLLPVGPSLTKTQNPGAKGQEVLG